MLQRAVLISALLLVASPVLAKLDGCEGAKPIPASKRERFYPALIPFFQRGDSRNPLVTSPLCPIQLLSLLDDRGLAMIKEAGFDPANLLRRLRAEIRRANNDSVATQDGKDPPAATQPDRTPIVPDDTQVPDERITDDVAPQVPPSREADKPNPPAITFPNWQDLPRITRSRTGALRTAPTNLILDRYVVVLNDERLRALGLGEDGLTVDFLTRRFELRAFNVDRVFNTGFTGFVLNGTADLARRVLADPLVAGLSQDRLMHTMTSAEHSAALDRIDQDYPELDGTYERPVEVRDVRVYLIDTGIREDHEELSGKISMWRGIGSNLAGDAENACNSHGTAMASLITGRNLGVADRAALVDVVIAPCRPGQNDLDPVTFPATALLDAMSWIAGQEVMRSFQPGFVPAVVNMSVGTQADWVTEGDITLATTGAFEQALRGFIQSTGAIVVAAAGNEGADACRIFPAHMAEVITVGGATADGQLADFSNFGTCVNTFALGENQTTASARDTTSWQVENGTSGAAALVSGIAAHRLARGESRQTVEQALIAYSATPVQINAAMASLLTHSASDDTAGVAQTSSLQIATILPSFTCAVQSPDGFLALRMAADHTSGKIRDLPNGTRFHVLQRAGRWALIQPEGEARRGWSAMSAGVGQLAVSLDANGPC